VEASRKRKTFKFNSPPPGWRAASLNPGQKMMERYAAGESVAVAITEAWNPARSEVRRQTVRHVRVERQSTPTRPLHGHCIPDANLDALLASWRATRSLQAFDTAILSARPWLEKVCRAITRSDDFSELYGKVEELLLATMADESEGVHEGVKAYIRSAAQKIHAEMLRRQYVSRKMKDGETTMTRFLPLSAADHLTADDENSADDLWERSSSTVDDAGVEAIARMLQDGQTVEQICRTLGITRSAVYKRIDRYLARTRGGIDLNACVDDELLHIVQADDAERLHIVQATETNDNYFQESCPLSATFAEYILEGDFFPLEMLPSGPMGTGDVIASLHGA
jgi:transposase-like protein